LIHEYLHEKRLKIIKRHLNNGVPDLDLGAGKKHKAEISLDIDAVFKPDVVADVQFLPLRNNTVNSIVCSHLIEHLKDIDRSMREIKRVLKQDGIVFFFLPNDGSILWRLMQPLWTIYYEKAVSKESSPRTHTCTFDYKSFEQLVRKFFEPLEMGKINIGTEIYAICRRY